MRSPAPKQAESEFDDLLGQLVDELAMTPPSESAVALVAEPPVPSAEARVDSTHHLAAEAAAAARARVQSEAAASSNNNLVKIVGIIAGSLTVVAVAALLVFANQRDEGDAEDSAIAADQGERDRLAERARAEQAAVEQAQASAIALEEAKERARKIRVEAELLQAKAQAATAEQKAEAPKPKPAPRKKPKPKPKPGDSFEDL